MAMKNSRARRLATFALALALTSAGTLHAQTTPSTHNLSLSAVTQTTDANGRKVLVAHVSGDLPGILTLALVIGPSGVVTGGEWALNVSYIQFGPPDADGDGDPSESLVQRGVIKGAIMGGSAVLNSNGLATDLSGIQLQITGATVQFAATTSGSGSVLGSSINQQAASSGLLAITF